MQRNKFSRALISVTDKTGISELAEELVAAGVEIIASDGTAAHLSHSGIKVRTVSEVTGYPELLGGKVKTLHPVIHAAILAKEDEFEQLKNQGILPIDLVIINLYPAESFDIGGPALIRAAAKNRSRVSIITSVDQYQELRNAITLGTTLDQREKWAQKAILSTAAYDLEIARERGTELRYGENPHQRGWISGRTGLAAAPLLQGKAMSFNNYLDADAGIRATALFSEPTIAIIKHAIPAGIASASKLSEALSAAIACDPISCFGGVVVANRNVTREEAAIITESFFEVLIAPTVDNDALEILGAKKNLRVLALGNNVNIANEQEIEERLIDGGFIFQDRDAESSHDHPENWTLVSGKALVDRESLLFAWRAVRCVRSNAIVICKGRATVGIGSGQVNRVDAARIALSRAGERASQGIAASDAFFPFSDGLQLLIDAGVTTVIQPGGSVRDGEVIDLARAAGITMYLTGVRHFSHN